MYKIIKDRNVEVMQPPKDHLKENKQPESGENWKGDLKYLTRFHAFYSRVWYKSATNAADQEAQHVEGGYQRLLPRLITDHTILQRKRPPVNV